MSEANILNPSASSVYNPDYAYQEGTPDPLARAQADSGPVYSRIRQVRGKVFELTWGEVLASTMNYLRQWEAQYRNGYFTFYDVERDRYYTGNFAAPLAISPLANNKWSVRGTFVEIPGLPMSTYPSNWSRDAIFIEEYDDYGNRIIKLGNVAGYSAIEVQGFLHGGQAWLAGGAANFYGEWMYVGYGFRLWYPKRDNNGKFDISLDGTVVSADVDGYASPSESSLANFTKADVKFGKHTVRVTCKNTKNASSSGYFVYFDAIEVIQ